MTLYDGMILTFILIGIIIIIVSFLFSKYDRYIEEDEKKKHTKRMDEVINYDEVRHKILELNEYGEYLKEELDKKHKELLFMYQMILEKQKELQIDALEKQVGLNMEKNVKVKDLDKNSEDRESLSAVEDLPNVNGRQNIAGDIGTNQTKVNYNKEILDLSLAGYKVHEIAKKLDIGQGQVELVLKLYK